VVVAGGVVFESAGAEPKRNGEEASPLLLLLFFITDVGIFVLGNFALLAFSIVGPKEVFFFTTDAVPFSDSLAAAASTAI
jgi:hypothetical protein